MMKKAWANKQFPSIYRGDKVMLSVSNGAGDGDFFFSVKNEDICSAGRDVGVSRSSMVELVQWLIEQADLNVEITPASGRTIVVY